MFLPYTHINVWFHPIFNICPLPSLTGGTQGSTVKYWKVLN
jgi:hypothetical protein